MDAYSVANYYLLYYTAGRGHVVICKFLVSKGANLGKSLFIATEKENLKAAIILVNLGADVSIKNSDGKTCFDLLSANGRLMSFTQMELNTNLKVNIPLLEAHNCALWFVIVQEDCASDADLFAKLLATVEALVISHPILAAAKDANNRAALDVASRPMRKVIESVIFFCGQYRIHQGPPVHMSATAVVVFADDFGVDNVYKKAFNKVIGGTKGGTMDLTDFEKALEVLKVQGFGGAVELLDAAASKDGLKGHFKHCDKDNDGSIVMPEFVEYCGNMISRSRRVAIKFMKNEDQYLRELSMRKNLEPQYVVDLLDGPNEDIYAKAVTNFHLKVGRDDKGKQKELSLQEYKHCIIMPAADRTLDAIFRSERPDIAHVRVLMKEIAEALAHLHQNNIIHGDLKMLNILRVDGRMRLIDLDAACTFDETAGCKFSSGVLPPEMFAYLTVEESEQFTTYWKRIFTKDPKWTSTDEVKLGQADSELWEKVKSRITDGKLVVVKTFAMDDNKPMKKPIVVGLPYEKDLVKASVAIDMWAFGVLLYYLISASPLLSVNRDEDLLDKDYARILEWADKDDKMLKEMIEAHIRLKDSSAADLLLNLLHPNPALRWDVASVLKSDFFNPSTHVDGESSGMTRQLMQSIATDVSKIAKVVDEVKDDIKEVKKDVKTALVKLDSISEQIDDLKEFQRMGFEALQQQAMRYHEEDKDYFKAQAAMLDAQFELLQSVDGKIDGLSAQVAKGFLKMESTFDRVGAKLVTDIMANGESQLKNFEEFQRQLNGLQADSKDLPAQIKMMVESSMSSMTEDITAKLRESMVEVTLLPSYL